MADILINGDIYVNVYAVSNVPEKSIKEAQNLLASSLTGEETEEEIYEKYLNFLEDAIESDTDDREYDYVFNSGFYRLIMNTGDPCLFNPSNNCTVFLGSFDNLNEKYLNLNNFIEKANYIGRYLEPLDINLPSYIALYEYENIYLLKDFTTGKYTTEHKNNLKDYKLGLKSEHFNRLDVYRDIIDQEMKQGYNRK